MLYGNEWESGEPERDLSPAITSMLNADYHMGQAVNKLCSALTQTEGTEYEKKLEELVQQFEDLRCDIAFLRGKVEKGDSV